MALAHHLYAMNHPPQIPRRDRLLREREHDPYKSREKPAAGTWCPDCGLVFHKGRWARARKPKEPKEQTCPACQRIRDGYPAGYVHITGSFFDARRDDLEGLIQNVERLERGEHPLNRVMAVEREGDETIVTTTDARLARAIGDALHRAHEGDLDYDYVEGSDLLHVHWRR
jgi:hypothetical protein